MDNQPQYRVPLLEQEAKAAQVDSDEQSSELERNSIATTELLVDRPSAVSQVSRIASLPGGQEDHSDISWDTWVKALQQDQLRSHYQRFVTWMTMDNWAIKMVVACFVRQHHIRQPDGPCCLGELHGPPGPRSNAWPLHDLAVIRRINAAASGFYAIEFVVGHLWSWTLLAFKLNDAYQQLGLHQHCGPHGIQQWVQDAPSYSLLSNLFFNRAVFATVGGGMLGFAVMKALLTCYSLKRVRALSPKQLSITATSTEGRTTYDIHVRQDAALSSHFLAGNLAWGEDEMSWYLGDHQANRSCCVLQATGRHLLQTVIEDQNAVAPRLTFLRHAASQQGCYPLPPYQSSRWGDSCGVLLPWCQTSSALTQVLRSLMWDGSLSFNDRKRQLDYLQQMATRGGWIAACSAIGELSTIAHAHHHSDLEQLLREGLLSRPQYQAQLTTKARALAVLHHLVQQPLTASTAFKRLWIDYHLWHLGHNPNPLMHLAFWPIKAWKLYAKIALLLELYRGAKALIQAYQNQQDCQQQARFWTYVHEIKAYNCTVCYNADAVVPLQAVWDDVSCWEALLISPRAPSTVIDMIQRLNRDTIHQADCSRQHLSDSFIQTVFPALAQHTHSLSTLILGSATQPVHIRFNHSAIILAQALEAMNTTNLTVYWDDHPVISVFVEHFPRTLRYANLLPQPGKHLNVSGESAAWLPTRLPVDTLSLSEQYLPSSFFAYYELSFSASRRHITLHRIGPALQSSSGVDLFLIQFVQMLKKNVYLAKLRHLILNLGNTLFDQELPSIVTNITEAHHFLESLDVSGNKRMWDSPRGSMNRFMTVLSHSPFLKSINLNADLVDDGIAGQLFQNLHRSSSIQIIDLSNNIINGTAMESLGYIKTLKKLNISQNLLGRFGEEGIQALAWGLAHSPSLQSLDVSMNLMGTEVQGVNSLLKSVQQANLSYLNVSHNLIGLHRLNISLWNETLSQFQGVTWDISYNCFPPETIHVLQSIAAQRNSTLIGLPQYLTGQALVDLFRSKRSSINLSGQLIGYAGVNRTILVGQELAVDPFLHRLDMSQNGIGATGTQGVKALGSGIGNSTSLTYVDVGGNSIGTTGTQGVEALGSGIGNSTSLTYIDVSGNGIGGRYGIQGTIALGWSIGNSSSLRCLNASNNEIGSYDTQGIEALARGVASSLSLTYLDVSQNFIGSRNTNGTIALGWGIGNSSSLQYLDMTNNAIGRHGTQGTETLAKGIASSRSLKYFGIGWNNIASQNIQATIALAKAVVSSPSLQYFDATMNEIGSWGTQDIKILIIGLKNNTSLRHLDLSYNPINCVQEDSQEIFYLWTDTFPYIRLKSLNLSHLLVMCRMNDIYAISNTTAQRFLLAAINSTLDVMDLTGSLNTSQPQPFAEFLQPFRRSPAIYNFSQHLNTSTLDQSFRAEVGRGSIADIASNLSHPHCNWTTLKLPWSGINNTGVKLLAPQLHLSRVTTVDLRYNEITDDGAQALAKALVSDASHTLCPILFLNSLTSTQHKNPITPLQHLLLAGNRIGPKGIDALCSALSLTFINILEVGLYQQNTTSTVLSQFDPTTCRQRSSTAPASHANLSSLWHHSAAISNQEAEMPSFSISRHDDLEGAVVLFALLGLISG